MSSDANTETTAVVQQTQADIKMLSPSKYLLQLAKSVSTPTGQPTFSIVFQSSLLSANMATTWSDRYALNWTTVVPAPGSKVPFSGEWQPCKLGESYELDANGFFQFKSGNASADKNSLNVASNNYPVGVYIIVGVPDPKNPSSFTPIWIDRNILGIKNHGEYTPRGTIQLWYQSNDQTGAMISNKGTVDTTKDMTGVKNWYFHYKATDGAWEDQNGPFQSGA